MLHSRRLAGVFCCVLVVALGVPSGPRAVLAEDPPQPRFMLEKFQPLQAGVEYERPDAADVDKCQVAVDRSRTHSGWKVVGPAGQVLRRFLDTNQNNLVDQWRYYQM